MSLSQSADNLVHKMTDSIPIKLQSKYNFKYLVVLDFEATCDNSKSFQPSEIIEWPAIIIDVATKTIHNSPNEYFHFYIKPTVHPKLTDFCTDLTKITQKMVDNGVSIEYALDAWNQWCYDNDLLPDPKDGLPKACIVTCGDWDLRQMWKTQCKVSNFSFSNPAMLFAAWINVKDVFLKLLDGKCKKGGMMGMMQQLNIKHEGIHHSGIDDVKNICKIVVELLSMNPHAFGDYTAHYTDKKLWYQRSLFDDVIYKVKRDKKNDSNFDGFLSKFTF